MGDSPRWAPHPVTPYCPMTKMDRNGSTPGRRADETRCSWIRLGFRFCSQKIATVVGSPVAFLIASFSVVIWALLGPHFHYSDTWQLVINTSTTIVTFLMVFLIQNTQNRDTKAIHLKLDELIRGLQGPRTNLVGLEQLSDEQLEELQREFDRIRKRIMKRDQSADAAHAE